MVRLHFSYTGPLRLRSKPHLSTTDDGTVPEDEGSPPTRVLVLEFLDVQTPVWTN